MHRRIVADWKGFDALDEEVRRITDECYAEARRLLRENRDKLDAIVGALLERESLDEPEIYAAAGIRFDFSTEYLRTLADFVRDEMAQL